MKNIIKRIQRDIKLIEKNGYKIDIVNDLSVAIVDPNTLEKDSTGIESPKVIEIIYTC